MVKGEKKSAKVSIKDWERVVKGNFSACTTEPWFGVPVTIKYTISFSEMLEFVDGVVATCFDDEHGYLPEVRDFATYNNILKYYTNLTLPEDLDKKYDLIYGSNIIEFVMEHISALQWADIDASISRKIKHIVDTNVKGIEKNAIMLLDAFEDLQRLAGDMFEGVNVDDVRNLTHALSEHGPLDEEKIVRALMDNQNKIEEESVE